MEHLDENALVGYVGSGLSNDERRRVEQHIDECASCRETLALIGRDPEVAPPDPLEGPIDSFELPEAGERIADRFTIVRMLGRGGMGCVFQATDEDLGIQVALKILRPELTESEEQVRHLRREILAGRKIAHPNVCRVFDLGKSDRVFFITMELVAGGTLHDLLQVGPLSRGETLKVLEQLLSALAAAHDERIVHRDLKPANLMFDEAGRLKVMDFGLARDLEGEHSLQGYVGTPSYWSPEQARGEAAGPPADLYAVGLLACMLLAGAASPRKHREYLDRVPELYRPWVTRCLHDEPTGRFPHARAALAALAELRARDSEHPSSKPVVVRPAQDVTVSGDESTRPAGSPPEPSTDAPTQVALTGAARPRRRTKPAALAILLAAAAGAGAYAMWPRGSSTPETGAPAASLPAASLGFVVEPERAIVEIDGRDLGSAREAELEPGVHTIVVRRDGFKRWTRAITLRDHERQTVHVVLERGVAHVAIDSTPGGLPIELDGEPTAHRTPATFDASAGVHRIRVVNAMGEPWTQEFTAEVDGSHSFHAAFVATSRPPVRIRPDHAPHASPPPVADPVASRESQAPPAIGSAAVEPPPAPAPVDAPQPPPTRPARTAVVAASAVTKLSGEVPTIVADGGDSEMLVKMCIDELGAVTSVTVLKSTAAPITDIQRALRAWRYKPYLNRNNQPSPVCFPLSLQVVVKRAD